MSRKFIAMYLLLFLVFFGACTGKSIYRRRRIDTTTAAPCPVSEKITPVCGNNGMTYKNMDELNCETAVRSWIIFDREGPCNGYYEWL